MRKARSVHQVLCNQLWAMNHSGLEAVQEAVNKAVEKQSILAEPGFTPADSELTQVRDGIAVIEVIGPIFHYRNILTELFGLPSSEALVQELKKALEHPGVEQIALQIDSPGGQVGGIAELAGFIREQRTKPIVAYVGDMAASAAYWMASAADWIAAAPTAELGSIGVVFSMRRRSNNRLEIVSSTSPKKRPDPETDEGRKQIQQRADAIAEVFIQAVMTNRGMKREQVLSLAGDVTIAAQAIELGFADGLGSLESFMSELKAGKILKGGKMLARPGISISKLEQNPAGAKQPIKSGQTGVESLTAEQLAVAKQVFGSKGQRQAETLSAPEGASGDQAKAFEAEVAQIQKAKSCSRSQAMAQVAKDKPDLHEAWVMANQPKRSTPEARQPRPKHQFEIDAELISVEQNIPLSKAMSHISAKNPTLHAQYLQEVNQHG